MYINAVSNINRFSGNATFGLCYLTIQFTKIDVLSWKKLCQCSIERLQHQRTCCATICPCIYWLKVECKKLRSIYICLQPKASNMINNSYLFTQCSINRNKSTTRCIICPFKTICLTHVGAPQGISVQCFIGIHNECTYWIRRDLVSYFTSYRVHKLIHRVDLSDIESRSRWPKCELIRDLPMKRPNTKLGDAGSIILQVIVSTSWYTVLALATLKVGQGDPNTNSSETSPCRGEIPN